MNINIIDNGSSYIKKLSNSVKSQTTIVTSYDHLGVGTESSDLIILSGSHDKSVVRDADLFQSEIDLITGSKVPILGICFGFELIAYTFGAKLSRLEAKEQGVIEIHPTRPSVLFSGLNSIQVYESHRWVVQDPGPNLVSLAQSRGGIEAFRHAVRPIFGFQFHPEMFPSQTQGDEIFANLLKIVQNQAT